MIIFKLEKQQRIPIDLKKAWAYFSSPRNLIELTPPNLSMTVTSDVPEVMYPGAIITYTIKPLWGIQMTWVTEITHCDEGRSFVDEQRFGPYRFWHHRHTFKEVNGGVEIGDVVHYGLPFGPLSSWVNAYYIQDQLDQIFNFRATVLHQKFGTLS